MKRRRQLVVIAAAASAVVAAVVACSPADDAEPLVPPGQIPEGFQIEQSSVAAGESFSVFAPDAKVQTVFAIGIERDAHIAPLVFLFDGGGAAVPTEPDPDVAFEVFDDGPGAKTYDLRVPVNIAPGSYVLCRKDPAQFPTFFLLPTSCAWFTVVEGGDS
jgi:hypothetical protein